MCRPPIAAAATLWLSLFATTIAQSPLEIQWSSSTFGPDGPWYAVTVTMGAGNTTDVSLFPAGSGPSNVLGMDYCHNTRGVDYCNANPEGYWSPSYTSNPPADSSLYTQTNLITNWMKPIAVYMPGDGIPGGLIVDTMSLPVSGGGSATGYLGNNIIVDGNYSFGLPQSQSYPYSLGTLSLGYTYTGVNRINNSTLAANITPNYFYETGNIPSASWGLHYGSVTAGVSPSLIYGGYDQSRVIGPVISKSLADNGATQLQIRDISIGTASGGLPIHFQNKTLTGLLDTNSTSPSVLTVDINPGTPYLALPPQTCDSISQLLPVIYNEQWQLYMWDKHDPDYENIINGANYLAFTFTGLTINDVTIKVPFQLLNLTLESPITDTPTSYFPCFATEGSSYALGRAFLQAAFFGGNWMPQPQLSTLDNYHGTWFLAQAPGPNLPASTVSPIGPSDTSISSFDIAWEDTWRNTWHPLASDGSSTTSNASGGSSGLSPGVQAAIAVPVTIVGLALIAGVVLWMWRRKRRSQLGASFAHRELAPPAYVHEKSAAETLLRQPSGEPSPGIHEVPASTNPRYGELSEGPRSYEMPAN